MWSLARILDSFRTWSQGSSICLAGAGGILSLVRPVPEGIRSDMDDFAQVVLATGGGMDDAALALMASGAFELQIIRSFLAERFECSPFEVLAAIMETARGQGVPGILRALATCGLCPTSALIHLASHQKTDLAQELMGATHLQTQGLHASSWNGNGELKMGMGEWWRFGEWLGGRAIIDGTLFGVPARAEWNLESEWLIHPCRKELDLRVNGNLYLGTCREVVDLRGAANVDVRGSIFLAHKPGNWIDAGGWEGLNGFVTRLEKAKQKRNVPPLYPEKYCE